MFDARNRKPEALKELLKKLSKKGTEPKQLDAFLVWCAMGQISLDTKERCKKAWRGFRKRGRGKDLFGNPRDWYICKQR